jgi:sugar phosphate isomerase/epimerase
MHLEPLSPALAAFGLVLAMAGSALAADTAPLRIGYTTEDRALAKAAGFDYVEIRIGELMKLSEPEFEKTVQASRGGLPALAAYTFLPGELKIVGPQVDVAKVDSYVTKALERCGRLGVKFIVFGAGVARNAPDGFSKDEAFRQLVAFGKRVAPDAARHGITIAAQPITRAQTNMGNTAAETAAWVDAVGHPNFQMSLDLYHTVEVGDAPAAAVLTAGPRLKYAKISNPKGRQFPASPDEYDYAGYLAALRRIGYAGPLGMETASVGTLAAEAPRSIALLRGLWKSRP